MVEASRRCAIDERPGHSRTSQTRRARKVTHRRYRVVPHPARHHGAERARLAACFLLAMQHANDDRQQLSRSERARRPRGSEALKSHSAGVVLQRGWECSGVQFQAVVRLREQDFVTRSRVRADYGRLRSSQLPYRGRTAQKAPLSLSLSLSLAVTRRCPKRAEGATPRHPMHIASSQLREKGVEKHMSWN